MPLLSNNQPTKQQPEREGSGQSIHRRYLQALGSDHTRQLYTALTSDRTRELYTSLAKNGAPVRRVAAGKFAAESRKKIA